MQQEDSQKLTPLPEIQVHYFLMSKQSVLHNWCAKYTTQYLEYETYANR